MNFYYYDVEIKSASLKEITKSNFFSNIILGTQSLESRFKNQVESLDFISIRSPDDITIKDEDDFIIFSSNIIFKENDDFKIFLETLRHSLVESAWGNTDNFIFKGKKQTFFNFLKNNNSNLQVNQIDEKFAIISSIFDLKKNISENLNSRYFNEVSKIGKFITKKSTNKEKLKEEYLFLNSVPSPLKEFYVEPGKFLETKNHFEYSTKAYDILDVSYQYISGSLNNSDILNLFKILNFYFERLHLTLTQGDEETFDEILKKNNDRFSTLTKMNVFNALNNFIYHHKNIHLEKHFDNINNNLLRYKKNLIQKGKVYAHGDLCFSNILFSSKKAYLKLIDPKGFSKSKGMRTGYYELAKLSHSYLGDYDLIVNNLAKIEFDTNMNAKVALTFKKDNSSELFFKDFVNEMNYEFKIVRLLESSLFLSMLPLHAENSYKVFLLALKSVEVFEDYLNLN
jgi:hypothetical protein